MLETTPIRFGTQLESSEGPPIGWHIRGQEMEGYHGWGRHPFGERLLHPGGRFVAQFE